MIKYFFLFVLCVNLPIVHADETSKTYELKPEFIVSDIVAYGIVEADARALSFEVGGEVGGLFVNSGAQVTQGQILARLDTALLRNQEQRLQVQMAHIQRKLEKNRFLIGKGSIPETLVEDQEHEYNMLELELAQVRINLEKHQLKAPTDGIILSRQLEHPRLVQPGETLFVFKSTNSPWQVNVKLSPSEIRLVQPGDKAYVEFIGGEVLAGQVELIKRQADPSDSSQEVVIVLDPSSSPLSAGAKISVRITPSNKETGYWIPVNAFSQIHNNTGNLLLLDTQDNTIVKRRVRLAFLKNGHFAVFDDLSTYEQLIVTAH